jgi:hypothetical protein
MLYTRYKKDFDEPDRVLHAACGLSEKTYGRPAEKRNVELAFHAFAKLCVHARAMLALTLRGPLGGPAPATKLQDASSMTILTRAVVDNYYNMFYLAIDEVDEEARHVRLVLCNYHSEMQRLK